MKIRDVFLSLLSGALWVLAFPKFHIEILAWMSLVPFLWAIRNKTAVQGAVLGFLSGFVFNVGLYTGSTMF